MVGWAWRGAQGDGSHVGQVGASGIVHGVTKVLRERGRERGREGGREIDSQLQLQSDLCPHSRPLPPLPTSDLAHDDGASLGSCRSCGVS